MSILLWWPSATPGPPYTGPFGVQLTQPNPNAATTAINPNDAITSPQPNEALTQMAGTFNYTYVQGDGQELATTLLLNPGNGVEPQDLTSATGVTCVIYPVGGAYSAPTISRAATIISPATLGEVYVILTSADSLPAGSYNVEWVVTFTGGIQRTWPGSSPETMIVRAR